MSLCRCEVGYGLRSAGASIADACAPCSENCQRCSFDTSSLLSTCDECAPGFVLDKEGTECVTDPSIAEQRLNLHEMRVFNYSLWPALVVGLLILIAILICCICICYNSCCKKEDTKKNVSTNSQSNMDGSQVYEEKSSA